MRETWNAVISFSSFLLKKDPHSGSIRSRPNSRGAALIGAGVRRPCRLKRSTRPTALIAHSAVGTRPPQVLDTPWGYLVESAILDSVTRGWGDCDQEFSSERVRRTHQGLVHGTPPGRRVSRKKTRRCLACGDVHVRLREYVGVRTFDLGEPPVASNRPPRFPVAVTVHDKISGPEWHALGAGPRAWFPFQERPPPEAECSCFSCGRLHHRRRSQLRRAPE